MLVDSLQGFRGIVFLTAVSIAAEVGDLRRFSATGKFMSYVGLVPSKYSSGNREKRGSITRCGNACRATINIPDKKELLTLDKCYSKKTTGGDSVALQA